MRHNIFIAPDDLLIRLEANTKKQVLQNIVQHAATRVKGLDSRAVLELIMEREKLGCTSIGDGIAIPHARCAFPEGRTAPLALLATLDTPIDFEASDDKHIDIVFMLLGHETSGGEHLTALALVSRILREKSVIDALRLATTRQEAWELLTHAGIAKAAA